MAILNQFGRPVQSGLFRMPSSQASESRQRPILAPNHFQNLTQYQRDELVNYSLVIYAGVPNIKAAIKMKANFAFADGWMVNYKGTNEAYGKRMEPHINETFYRDCNILGSAHDFHATLKEFSTAMDTTGQIASMFDPDSGRVMVFPATRIGTGAKFGFKIKRQGSFEIIDDPNSPFNGSRIIDGIIVDRKNTQIGTRILGVDDNGKPTYTDYPVSQCPVWYEAGEFPDQVFGVPTLATAVLPVIKVEDFDYYIKQAMILSAAMAVNRKSKDGHVPASNRVELEEDTPLPDGTTAECRVAYQEVAAGIVELASNNGEELATLDFNRPSMNEQQFIERVETGYFAEHWPRALIYQSDLGRAGMRAIGQQVRMIVWQRQQNAEKFARWLVNHRIAWAMRNGRIPNNPAQYDAFNYEFSLPAEFSTDEGNDAEIELKKLARGITSHRLLAGKLGYNDQALEDENFAKQERLMAKAEKLAQQHPTWTAKEILLRIDNPYANPPQEQKPADKNEEKPKKEEK